MPHARKPGEGARGHQPRSRRTVTGNESRTAGAGISFSASYRPARRPRRHLPDKAWSLPAASGTDRRPRRIMLSRLSFRRSRSFDATPYEFQRRHRLSTRWQELIYHGDKGGLRQAPTNNELILCPLRRRHTREAHLPDVGSHNFDRPASARQAYFDCRDFRYSVRTLMRMSTIAVSSGACSDLKMLPHTGISRLPWAGTSLEALIKRFTSISGNVP